jgi:hypothetical protein
MPMSHLTAVSIRNPQSAIRNCLILIAVLSSPLRAQSASPYLPLTHWTMPYVEHLISAGRMVDPTPLARPFRTDDLVRALEAIDSSRVARGEWQVVTRMLHALRRSERGPWGRIEGAVGASAASYAVRDPLELGRGIPERGYPSQPRGFAQAGLDLALGFGPVVAVTHPVLDTRLKYDPDWFGKKNRAIAGRTAESYVSAQWQYGEVFFGRLDRNWGPSVAPGALLSADPYGLDHLGITLGTSGIQLQAIATQLDSRVDSTGAAVHRYMVQHRLWVRPPGRWTVALWEGSVLSGTGRELEPWYLNIMNLGFLEQVNSGSNVNSFVGLDAEWHGAATVYGQFMLDDIQVDRKTPTDQKPASYAWTLGAKGGLPLSGAWTLFYTQVANLAYRNEDDLQVPLYHDLGTGRNFSDYDQATARLSFLGPAALLIEPEATLVRQGQGDPRLAHPLPADYPSTATLFQGVVERTVRLALGIQWTGGPIHFGGDAAVHLVSNDGFVEGVSKTRVVGRAGVEIRFGRESPLP